MSKMEFDVKGMHCKGCELGFEEKLEELNFIDSAKADFKKGKVKIKYDESNFDIKKVCEAAQSLGFEIIK